MVGAIFLVMRMASADTYTTAKKKKFSLSMYHIPSFRFKGNPCILQFTHNCLSASLSKVLFSMFVIALL